MSILKSKKPKKLSEDYMRRLEQGLAPIMAYVPAQLKERVAAAAQTKGLTLSDAVTQALELILANEE